MGERALPWDATADTQPECGGFCRFGREALVATGSKVEIGGGGEDGADGAVAAFELFVMLVSNKITVIDPSLSPIESAVPLRVMHKQLTPQFMPDAFQRQRDRSVRSSAMSGTFFHSIPRTLSSVRRISREALSL